MQKLAAFIFLLCLPLFFFAQQADYKLVLQAALKSPGIKNQVARNSLNKLCLQTIFTNNHLPGDTFVEVESMEIQLKSSPQPESLGSCEAAMEKFSMRKKKAKLEMQFGEDLVIRFTLKKLENKWYTLWMMSKRYVPVGDEVTVERTVNKFTYE